MPSLAFPRAGAEIAAACDPLAKGLTRGVCRMLTVLGQTPLCEFTLRTGRRVDVIALDSTGTITIVEVKTSVADFRTDHKWPEYLDYCDYFSFAVPADFPQKILPQECGVMVADNYGAAIASEPPRLALSPARRRSLVLRFAHSTAQRLHRLNDPMAAP